MDTPRLSVCVSDYLADCVAKGLSVRTVEHYRHALDLLTRILPADGWATKQEIRRAVGVLRQEPYTAPTLSMYLRAWKTFLRFCKDESFIDDDLGAYIKPPKSEPRRDPILSVTEVQRLLIAARQGANPHRDTAIVTLMYDCGLRAGEVTHLAVQNVDFGNRTITIPVGKTGGRSVPMGRATTRALRQWIARHPRGEGPLFPSARTGERMAANTLVLLFERLSERSGVRCHPHQLRHTFAVSYLRNGGDVFSLQRILGHTSLDMSRWYAELADADVQRRHMQASPGDRLGRG